MAETFQTIAQWCEETFGPATAERIASRAAEEMDELLSDPHKVEEAADIVIILSRHPTLWAEVERKMAVNRKRQWRLMGDGSGYHIPQPAHPDSATPSGDGGEASSTPGEVERLLDKLEGSIRTHEALAGDPYSHRRVEKLAADIEAARTALLSHISTGGRGEGACSSAVMRTALEFYADPKNWIDTPPWDGDPDCITPAAIPVRDEGNGSAPCDCGDTARAALCATDATNPQE